MSESKKKNPRKYRDKIEQLQKANEATNKEFEDAMRDSDNNVAIEDGNRLGPVRHKSGDNRASPYDIQRSRSLSPRPSKNKTVYLKPRDQLAPPVPASHLTRQRSDPYLSKSAVHGQDATPQISQTYNTLRPNAPVANNASSFEYQSNSNNYFVPTATVQQPVSCQPSASSQNYQTQCNGFGNDNQLYMPVNTQPTLINSSSQSTTVTNSPAWSESVCAPVNFYLSDSNQNVSYSNNLDASGTNVQYTQLQNVNLQPSSLGNSIPGSNYGTADITNNLHQPTTTFQPGNYGESVYVSNILQPGVTNSQEAALPTIPQPVTTSYQSPSALQTNDSNSQSNKLLYPRDNAITTIDHSAIAPVSNTINTLGDQFISKNTYSGDTNDLNDYDALNKNTLHISTSYVVTSQQHHQSPSRRHTTANLYAVPGGSMAPLSLHHQQRRHSDNIPIITITNADGEYHNSFSVHRQPNRTDSVSDHDDDLSRDSMPGSPAGSFVGQEDDSHTLGMGNDLKNIELDLDKLVWDEISKFE